MKENHFPMCVKAIEVSLKLVAIIKNGSVFHLFGQGGGLSDTVNLGTKWKLSIKTRFY